MGLLSKILGSDEKAKSVLDSIQKVADSVIAESADALKSVQNAAQSALDQSNGQQAANQANPVNAGSQVIQTPEPSAQSFDRGSAESGLSWGEFMPSEPNQHNFPGSYTEYFESIFREELPQFTVTSETVRNGTGTVYTFLDGETKALVIELMSDRCSAKALRRECQQAGVPYLRFYYDHDGWWNTRSYVVGRIQSALGIF